MTTRYGVAPEAITVIPAKAGMTTRYGVAPEAITRHSREGGNDYSVRRRPEAITVIPAKAGMTTRHGVAPMRP